MTARMRAFVADFAVDVGREPLQANGSTRDVAIKAFKTPLLQSWQGILARFRARGIR